MKGVGTWARLGCIAGVLTLGSAAAAIETGTSSSAGGASSSATNTQDQGLVPKRLVWPGIAVIVVIAIFVTAALTGPLIRANSDDESDTPPDSSD